METWMSVAWPWMHIAGRVLFGVSFFILSHGHFTQTEGTAGYAKSFGVPYPKVAVLVSGTMVWVGAALIILGWHRYIGAGLIVLFLVPVTTWIHPYWRMTDPNLRLANRINFWKNVGLTGGALFMACYSGWDWPMSLGG